MCTPRHCDGTLTFPAVHKCSFIQSSTLCHRKKERVRKAKELPKKEKDKEMVRMKKEFILAANKKHIIPASYPQV